MQTQNIQLSEILDTIEEMGDLSESAMEAARKRLSSCPRIMTSSAKALPPRRSL